jgi:hypothetical protein
LLLLLSYVGYGRRSAVKAEALRPDKVFNLLFTDGQHELHVGHIGLSNQTSLSQSALTLGGFFGQDVVLERFFAFYFSSSGKTYSFLSAAIGLHFWHISTYYIFIISFLQGPAG